MSLSEPIFGDVFEATASPVTRSKRIMYLRALNNGVPDWLGLDLNDAESGPIAYVPLDEPNVGWKFHGNAGTPVEMTCDHAHRGAITTQIHADLVWRGCTYQRLDAKGYASGGFISPATGLSYQDALKLSSIELREQLKAMSTKQIGALFAKVSGGGS